MANLRAINFLLEILKLAPLILRALLSHPNPFFTRFIITVKIAFLAAIVLIYCEFVEVWIEQLYILRKESHLDAMRP